MKKLKMIKISDIVISLLLSFLFTLSIICNGNDNFDLTLFLIYYVLSFIITFIIWNKLKNIILYNKKDKISKKEFLLYAFLIISVLVFAIICYYPGYVYGDTIDQFREVQNGIYNNWHPVLHTLFLYKLPSLIYNSILFSTIFQCLIIFLIMIYFCYFLRKNFLSFYQTLFVLIIMILNPLFVKYSVCLLKDVLYSWFLFLSTLYVINVVITKGEWIKSNLNKILFIISSLGILCFRHNGIVPFILMYVSLIIFYPNLRKFFSISLIGIMCAFFVVTGPVFKFFKIDSKTGGKPEMIGIVMGQISYYYHNGVISDKNDIELLDEISPIKYWNNNFNPRSFNVIKWASENYQTVVNENFNKIIHLWLKASIEYPALFIKSYVNMTSPIWETTQNILVVNASDYNNELIMSKGNLKSFSENNLNIFRDYTNKLNGTPLRWLFVSIGEALLLIILGAFIVLNRAKWNIKSLLPFVMVLVNTLVIMFMITGEEIRFVYSQAICVIPLLIYSFSSYVQKDLAKEKTKLEKFTKKMFINKTENTFIQFFRYIFVGGIAAIVNIGMLYVFTDIFKIYYIISNVLSFTLGLIANYLLSKKFVFQKDTTISKKKEFIIYGLIGVLGLGFDTLFVWLFTNFGKIYYLLSKIISTILVFIWNFVARKVFYKVIK